MIDTMEAACNIRIGMAITYRKRVKAINKSLNSPDCYGGTPESRRLADERRAICGWLARFDDNTVGWLD